MGEGPEQTFLQRKYNNDQEAHGKMVHITTTQPFTLAG